MITVFGSINIDLVTRVKCIPGPGETVLGPSYDLVPGGKGANQALAARRAGARVALVGAIGRDGFANAALLLLRAEGVDLSAVAATDAPTGAAFIAVDAQGENAIVVAAGANALARAAQIERLALANGDILLLQRETPDAEGEAAARHAKARGARVILNLAPAGTIVESYLRTLDVLIMNEHEAATLGTGLSFSPSDLKGPEAVARAIDRDFGMASIVTLGAAGAIGWAGGVRHAARALPVAVVDTTAAGDAFSGAFAAALACGRLFADAVRYGVAAGSLACTTAGAQPSLPRAADIAVAVERLTTLDAADGETH